MEITRIVVSAQRKLPHPETEFATFSAMATLEAVVAPNEDITVQLSKLQNMADSHVDRHMQKVEDRFWMSQKAEQARRASNDKAAALTKKHTPEVPF